MSKLQPVRGTKDLIFDDYYSYQNIVDISEKISSFYGFKGISTPIFEFSEIFTKTLGDTSDVVTKEMYSFVDKGGENITLRPEFTAAIVRAFISEGLLQNLPLKFFSSGPVFRYERPQKGRQRQFHQINFECLGIDNPKIDAEMIIMANHLLEKLGIQEDVSLELNSLGCSQSRENYRQALVEYFNKYKNELSEDSKIRLIKNPMRILDSKDEKDRKIIIDAPKMHNYFTPESRKFFDDLLEYLDLASISYKINQNIVRGLDYYSHTAFEFITDKLGSQSAVLAGGRYNGLVKMMGGPDVCGVGFAGGIERIMELSRYTYHNLPSIAIIPIGIEEEKIAFKMADQIRRSGFKVILDYSGNVGKRMKRADKESCNYALFLGEEELKNSTFKIKDMKNGTEEVISFENIVRFLSEKLNEG